MSTASNPNVGFIVVAVLIMIDSTKTGTDLTRWAVKLKLINKAYIEHISESIYKFDIILRRLCRAKYSI